VGVASYNHAATVGRVIRASEEGLAACGPAAAHIVLADGGSHDGTVAAAREAVSDPGRLIEVGYSPLPTAPVNLPYHGLPGRPRALRAVLEVARDRQAAVCVLLDAGAQAIEASWIERLVQPVLGGAFDYVSPYHLRHPYDGAITKSILHPVFRAVYGVGLHQPAAGDFACSLDLVRYCLDQDFWESEGVEAGIDIWLASATVCGGFRICEAVLGAHRTSAPSEAGSDLSTTIAQVVSSLFADLERYVDVWQRVRGSTTVPVTGSVRPSRPGAPSINLDRMVESFRLGYRELRDVWTWVLPPKSIVALRKAAEAPPQDFRLDDALWARIIYDFAIGYRLRVLPQDHLLRSLTPLYTGWMASFIVQTRNRRAEDVDQRLEEVCRAFEVEKPYLISRWRWPERLRQG
jgi:glucosylglycerate synthase